MRNAKYTTELPFCGVGFGSISFTTVDVLSVVAHRADESLKFSPRCFV